MSRDVMPGRGIADDGYMTQLLMTAVKLQPREAESLERRRAARGDQDVRVRQQFVNPSAALVRFQIKTHDVNSRGEIGVRCGGELLERIAGGRFNLDDRRAHAAQHGGCNGPGDVHGSGDDAKAGERAGHATMLRRKASGGFATARA